jgi:parvulin-like peptidyl-prolyl isomerase
MAKKPRKHAPKELTRKQLSRLERESRIQRLLVWGVIGVAVAVVGVLAYGFIVEKVVKAREPVAVVGDTPIRTSDFQARVRLVRAQLANNLQSLQMQQQMLDPTDSENQAYLEYIQGSIQNLESQLSLANAMVIGEQTLDQMIQEELVRQEAEQRGLSISPDELQQEIEVGFGYDRNPPPTPTPTSVPVAMVPVTSTSSLTSTATPIPTATPMTEQAFRDAYNSNLQILKSLGISERQYRSFIEASLLTQRLQEEMTAEVPDSADQVKLAYVTVDSEERATELAERLGAGEDFQAVLEEVQADEENPGFGTELDWLPRSLVENRLGAEVAGLAFSLGVGDVSQPVQRQDGTQYTVILVLGREERELDSLARDTLGRDAFQEWLEAEKTKVERLTYQDRVPTDP